MSVSFCLPQPVAVSGFMIYIGLCACTEMAWMGVRFVSFWSKVRPIVVYFEVQIARICWRVWREQSASCFVWI